MGEAGSVIKERMVASLDGATATLRVLYTRFTVLLFALAQRPAGWVLVGCLFAGRLSAMYPINLDPRMTVDEIMRRWPNPIRLFIQRRMLCIGYSPSRMVAQICDRSRLQVITIC
jgi:hypothetical protein